MKNRNKAVGALLISLYSFLVLVPLVILLTGPKFIGRPALLDLSVCLAFVGMAIMAMQFILSARIKSTHEPFGTDLVYHFHRQIGIAAFLLVFSHPILLFILDSRYLRLLNVFSAPLRIQFSITAIILLIGVAGMAEYRQKFKIPYWFWKLWHGIFASIMIPLALFHIFTGGSYIDLPWKKALWIFYSILFTLVVFYDRVIYPLRLIKNPYRIKQVKPERGGVWTIIMEPVNHKGFQFKPGQFAWLTAWKTPFSDSEHPFTIASSAERKDAIEMSIKSLGKFTSRIQKLEAGDKVFVDGPYGYYSLDRYPETTRLVFIPGGIGVTPVMSMLRSMVDRGDKRPISLFYCNQEWDTLTFREEVEDLQKKLNINVIYTIERPPQNWQGEKGFLNSTILNKYLPPEWKSKGTEVFLCGPAPMMNAIEKALLASGFSDNQIHTERFALV
jgi:3-phenylpropionate/trans-cinnamate dioxygenase ferredoxin reductase subunit